ncbi:type VI secretion system tip protein VgrG [Polyangium aurulentum]|nr:type VI secretion system tip protein VgrG [Polyangium aurulentum]
MASMSVGRSNLQVELASGDGFDVREFSVNERISSLFEISLTALCENPNVDFEAIVGQPARFVMASDLSPGQPRIWTGVCHELQQLGVEEEGLSTYHIGIVPTLWLATQRRNYRMFQHLSEPDIALKLLSEWGIEPSVKIDKASYKTRKYRVQYGESDFAFMSRMLEDAGISFYFKQKEGESKLVLSDSPHSNKARDPIAFRDNPTNADREHVTGVRVGRKVRPGKYTIRDIDYRRPPSYKLAASADGAQIPLEEKLERFHYTPGAFLFGTDKGGDSPVADDKAKHRTDEAEGQKLAKKRLEAKRSSGTIFTFDTNAPDLAPGVVTSFLDHPRADLASDKRLLIIEAHRTGTSTGEWTHTCEARSAAFPFRPSLSTPRPKVNGVESATVVGPPGEEIHTDEFGRVRVHFHWDRESKMDDASSCWIPVSQAWGGAGFGGVNLPRIGQEVIVDFLGGDPDRPVVMGRVFTNLQKVPWKLPDNKTQSGLKSNSTGGGGGFNELMFEDAAGKEQVRMQAERDYNKLVKNNEVATIGNDRTKVVKNDENVTIGNDRTKVIKNNENVTIGNDRTKLVQANENITIGKNLAQTVQQNQREVTGINRSVVVGVNRSTQVGGIDATMVGGTHSVMIAPPGEGGGGPATGYTMTEDNFQLGTTSGATITFEGTNITLKGVTITLDADNINILGKATVKVISEGTNEVSGKAQQSVLSSGGDVIIRGGPMVKINT